MSIFDSLATCRENQYRGHLLNCYKLFLKTVCPQLFGQALLNERPSLTKFPNDIDALNSAEEYTGSK